MPIRYIEHKSPPRLQMLRKEIIRNGKHFIEKIIYVDEKGGEHIKTVRRSKFF